jgi:hypothetical protein
MSIPSTELDHVDSQHTKAARTTTRSTASAKATAATAITIRCKPVMLFISRNLTLLFG